MAVAIVRPLRNEYRTLITAAQSNASPLSVNLTSISKTDITSALTSASLFRVGDVLVQDVTEPTTWILTRGTESMARITVAP